MLVPKKERKKTKAMNDESIEQLLQFEKDFENAIVKNNAEAIERVSSLMIGSS